MAIYSAVILDDENDKLGMLLVSKKNGITIHKGNATVFINRDKFREVEQAWARIKQ